jgi:hypothetical protein
MKRLLVFSVALLLTLGSSDSLGQSAQPTAAQLESWIAVRQQRVDLLRSEIKSVDSRIESRLDVIIETLTSIADSKDAKTKVARMKEDTMKLLKKTIDYYDQKRAAIREELRNPRSALTDADKRRIMDAFDRRIEKRTKQILALSKSMPGHEDYDRYRATGDNWYGTTYEPNQDYAQNRRMTSHTNTQRKAIVKELDGSIARLERISRDLQAQLASTTDPAQRKARTADLERNEALIAERKKQKLEVLTASGGGGRQVSSREAYDLDKAMKESIEEGRRDFNTLFARYYSLIAEATALRAAEMALANAKAKVK